METRLEKPAMPIAIQAEDAAKVNRRKFLSYAGMAAATAAALYACKKDDNNMSTPPAGSIDLGKGDVGILNYAYALEQLEAAFYTAVIATPYAGISAAELALLTDIRDHEIAHREFFKTALKTNAIPGLEVNFSAINFSSRATVLATAKTFEDLGVAAYNGAGKLIVDGGNLLLAGKIVSVEARHAALIRDLISNGTFADSTVIDADGLDDAKSPDEVLAAAKPFLKSVLWGGNLPKQ